MRKQFFWLVFTLLASCGGGDEEPSTRFLPSGAPLGSNSQEWLVEAIDQPMTEVSDAIYENGKAGGYYFISSRLAQPREIKARIKATLLLNYWEYLATLNPITIVPESLPFVCLFQTCSMEASDCAKHSSVRDFDQSVWVDGPETGITIENIDPNLNEEQEFEIVHELPANVSLRVFCHYHWYLHEAVAGFPAGAPPRVMEFSSRIQQ